MFRIAEAIKKAGGQTKVSDELGVNPKTVSRWEHGEAAAKFEDIVGLARLAGVSLEWIAGGAVNAECDTSPSEFIELPRYNASFSAGTGCFLDSAEIINTIPFRPEFFTKNLNRNASDMIIVDAQGDSMQPAMHDRDLVMIDKSTATETLFAGIYAFSYEGALYVKRLQKMPAGILATSDNKEYREFMIGAEAMDHFNLIGRVVWVGRMM